MKSYKYDLLYVDAECNLLKEKKIFAFTHAEAKRLRDQLFAAHMCPDCVHIELRFKNKLIK